MKKITGKWPASVRKTFDEETPFALVSILEDARSIDLYLFWTKGGAYGKQVRLIAFEFSAAKGESEVYTLLTAGCGYSKKIHALECAARELKIDSMNRSGNFGADPWHVGGNFYKADFRTGKEKSLLRLAAEMVVQNWEKGDLAGSVRALDDALKQET